MALQFGMNLGGDRQIGSQTNAMLLNEIHSSGSCINISHYTGEG